MTLGGLLLGGFLVGAIVFGPKLVNRLLVGAVEREEEAVDTAVGEPGSPGWKLGRIIASLAIGVMAVRGFWTSLPRNVDWGFGGLAVLMVVPVVFAIAFGIGYGILSMVGRHQESGPRAGLVGAVLLVLVLVVVLPMRSEMAQEEARRQAVQKRIQLDRIAAGREQMRTTPHAPPGVVPQQLQVQREGGVFEVTNRGDEAIEVVVQLVLPRGANWERCSLGVERLICTPGSNVCSYQLARDGTKVYSTATTFNSHPHLQPGESAKFVHRCDARFAAGELEFSVFSLPQKKHVFRSTSSFVPEDPPASGK